MCVFLMTRAFTIYQGLGIIKSFESLSVTGRRRLNTVPVC